MMVVVNGMMAVGWNEVEGRGRGNVVEKQISFWKVVIYRVLASAVGSWPKFNNRGFFVFKSVQSTTNMPFCKSDEQIVDKMYKGGF